jgi:hypothetical protein
MGEVTGFHGTHWTYLASLSEAILVLCPRQMASGAVPRNQPLRRVWAIRRQLGLFRLISRVLLVPALYHTTFMLA